MTTIRARILPHQKTAAAWAQDNDVLLDGDRLLLGITGRARGDKPAPTHLVARVTPAA